MGARIWNIIFLLGFAAYVGIRGVFMEKTRKNIKVERRVGLQERILLSLVFVGGVLLPVVYLFTPWLAFADYALFPLEPWAGAIVMVLALHLFHRSHADLGENWSQTLEIRAGHRLVTSGVYAKVRHPMYSAILLFSLAQGLMLANWLAGWSALCATGLMFALRIPHEERMMRETFGEEYRLYMARTGRLIPRMSSARKPPSHPGMLPGPN